MSNNIAIDAANARNARFFKKFIIVNTVKIAAVCTVLYVADKYIDSKLNSED